MLFVTVASRTRIAALTAFKRPDKQRKNMANAETATESPEAGEAMDEAPLLSGTVMEVGYLETEADGLPVLETVEVTFRIEAVLSQPVG
jgi:hypothetical protein